mmetsp:Transcript_142678/g.248803  ORF Transcript_142678/g.248803 Transcript_142678/m.248803 type:complete len:261 (-) Transcript_142678:70-852(-)
MPFDLLLHHVAHHLGLAGDHHEMHTTTEQHAPWLVAPAVTRSQWPSHALSSFLVPVAADREVADHQAISTEATGSLLPHTITSRGTHRDLSHASAFLHAPFAKERAHIRAKAKFYHEAAVDFKRTVLYRKMKTAVRRHLRHYGIVELFGAGLLAGSTVFLAIPVPKLPEKTIAEAALKARRKGQRPGRKLQEEDLRTDEEPRRGGPGRTSASLAIGAAQTAPKGQHTRAPRHRAGSQRNQSKRGGHASGESSDDEATALA